VKNRLHRLLPSRESLRENRWLRWLGPAMFNPRLWHFSRRGVAVGVAVGVFFGLLIPVAQIPFAAGAAVLLRANVPSAIGSTLVTNPVTFAPIYILAHKLGSALLGEPVRDDAVLTPDDIDGHAEDGPQASWWQRTGARLVSVGKPLLLGLAILATAFGLLTYFAILAGWKLWVIWTRRRRRTRGGHR
jgi:uncharacterized protein (DUF2062 family)